MNVKWLSFALFLLFILQACNKNSNPPTAKPLNTTYFKGSWQCQVDGIEYHGTIDTSYTKFSISSVTSKADTFIYCTGTSLDKRANIHFQLDFDRHTIRSSPYYSTLLNEGRIDFDTCSDNILQAFYNSQPEVRITVDSATSTSFQAHFSGTLGTWNNIGILTSHTVTNGRISAGWYGGNHDPNSFSFMTPGKNLSLDGFASDTVTGYFNSASMVSNTLVLDGMPISWRGLARFRLQVRTGGTIKPGTYRSENGDAGLTLFVPSINEFYMTDSIGSVVVKINQVTDNTVYGSFSGTNKDGSPLSSGSFALRVKNYIPQVDSINKWGFCMDPGNFPTDGYRMFAGNVLNVAFDNPGVRYRMTLNGESDNGASFFKFVVSSTSPISTGVYTQQFGNYPAGGNVDSFYFTSHVSFPTGTNTPLFGTYYSVPTQVLIDSFDNHHIAGRLKGYINLAPGSDIRTTYLQLGRFSADY